jgi:aminoglycoside phosphotransferase (APT) family kinase protein
MGINDEKGKSREDYVELWILYFIWVLWAPYYQEGYIRWVGEVQNIKNLFYHQKFLSDQTYPAP